MKKIAVILSGCGNRDGSELQETLSVLLAIDKMGMTYQCFAPQEDFKVVSYLDGQETGEVRGIFEESARIARGNILSLETYMPEDYDALVLPGGMGAARNWSSYAFKAEKMTVIPLVENAVLETYKAKKPVCAMCIAPMVLAKVLGPYHVTITLGDDSNTASQVARMLGAKTQSCKPTEVCVDKENKVFTTPAYMVATRISEIFAGAENMIKELTLYSE